MTPTKATHASLINKTSVLTDGPQWAGHMADDVAATYGPEPTAFLSANAEELMLSGERGTHRLRRDAVRRIAGGRMYPWFWGGIRIQAADSHMPEVQFKPVGVNRAEIYQQLRALGYPVG